MIRSLAAAALAATLFVAPASAEDYQLVWQDEFDGSSLDLGRWQPQIGTGCPNLCGWGNNELQYYRAENAVVDGGVLTIIAREESFGGRDYTSARLRTRNLADFLYGRFEMRARLPIGQGLWPAFWMLPTDNVYGTWAASGEIDIMEYVGDQPDEVFGTIHYGGTFPENTFSSRGTSLSSGTFHDDFHVFALEWDPFEMRWYVDGELYATQTNWYSAGGPYPAPFDQEFHLLLNLAVGGNLPGDPDASTVFPQEYVIDYVRVYERATTAPCVMSFDSMEHADPYNNEWFVFNGSVGGGGMGPETSDAAPMEGMNASLSSGWGSGGVAGFLGGFGRNNPMDLRDMTHFEMWLRPQAGQEYTLEINLQDDDDGDTAMASSPDGADDEFQYDLTVGGPGAEVQADGTWQRVSIPLDDFYDDGSYHWGGNGVFDPYAVGSGGNGMLVSVVLAVIGASGSDATFLTDQWAFTRQEGSLLGRVFDDADGDGVEDAGESGLSGVTVELIDVADDAVVRTATTASGGGWGFASLPVRAWRVRVDPATLPQDLDPTVDPDGIGTPGVFEIDLGCEENVSDLVLGYRSTATAAPDASLATELRQNVPNPFNPRTTIAFSLARPGPVQLDVLDTAGRRVARLVDGPREAGPHSVVWSGVDVHGQRVAGGVYFYRLRTDDGVRHRKMVLLE